VYNQSMPVNESKSRGLLGKLMGGGHSQPQPQAQYAPQQGYYQQGGCKLVSLPLYLHRVCLFCWPWLGHTCLVALDMVLINS